MLKTSKNSKIVENQIAEKDKKFRNYSKKENDNNYSILLPLNV